MEYEIEFIVREKESEEIVLHSTSIMGEAEDKFCKVLGFFTTYLKERHLKELEAGNDRELSEEEESLIDNEIKGAKEQNL